MCLSLDDFRRQVFRERRPTGFLRCIHEVVVVAAIGRTIAAGRLVQYVVVTGILIDG